MSATIHLHGLALDQQYDEKIKEEFAGDAIEGMVPLNQEQKCGKLPTGPHSHFKPCCGDFPNSWLLR
jgi:hypothetical protein